jgi:DNA-binding transcriptional MerR regulator
MRSGELARHAGVSVDTLRHYEKKRLLAPPHRAPNGYREYPESALPRVRLIQRALDMGFTLDDLARVLSERDGGGVPCGRVRAIAAARLQALEARIAGLQELHIELQHTIEDWDQRLIRLRPGQRAGLLEVLGATPRGASAVRDPQSTLSKSRRRPRN